MYLPVIMVFFVGLAKLWIENFRNSARHLGDRHGDSAVAGDVHDGFHRALEQQSFFPNDVLQRHDKHDASHQLDGRRPML